MDRFIKFYPIIGLTGPRQSGKTTLAKTNFPNLPYVSLENLDIRTLAKSDPRLFLSKYQDGAIFDEVQNVPELLSYLQEIVDSSDRKGRYILTGSQNFSLNEKISQSLSGRIGMTTLLPLSLQEISDINSMNNIIFKGGYPAIHSLNISPLDFYPSYIQTYIERDVRQLKNVGDLGRFQNFLKICAGRVGQIINFTSIAQDAGISHTTAREWLNILEASYIIFFLQPYYRNFSKRLIKMPKLYFYDTGIASALLGLEKMEQVDNHYLKGSLYENLVILEVLKYRLNQALPTNIYFWRDRTGHEIDLILESGGKIQAFEIKSGHTFQKDFVKNIEYFCKLSENIEGYVIYNGDENGKYKDVHLLPLKKIYSIL